MHNSTKRFSDRVDNYIKYRPGYPLAIISFLKEEAGLTSQTVIADIGSGTGISSELFLKEGNLVFGVEPNREMREAAEKLLESYSNFRSINATAENTLLLENSIDMVIAGQAFHWFDMAAFKQECLRIGKPGAWCILIWNERLENTAFLKDYEALIVKYSTDYSSINHKNVSEEIIAGFYAPATFKVKVFDNEQRFDYEGLRGRLESSSYIPGKDNPAYPALMSELEQLFARYSHENTVIINYETKLFIGKVS